MPRTAIPVTTIPLNGGVVDDLRGGGTAGDATNDHSFINDGQTLLEVTNESASSEAITVVSVACSHGRTLNVTLTPSLNDQAIGGPFPQAIFNQSDGTVHVDLVDSTSITFRALKYQNQ